MSAKEWDRLKVLHEVKKRYITQKQAAAELGLSVRWVRKLGRDPLAVQVLQRPADLGPLRFWSVAGGRIVRRQTL